MNITTKHLSGNRSLRERSVGKIRNIGVNSSLTISVSHVCTQAPGENFILDLVADGRLPGDNISNSNRIAYLGEEYEDPKTMLTR